MNLISIVSEQLISMFIVVLFGYILVKANVLTENGSKQIAKMLTQFVVPITLALAFQQEFDPNQLSNLAFAFLGAGGIFLSRILWAEFITRKRGTKIDRYSIIFSNSVYIGIPIIFPILGYDGIIYLSMYIVLSGILQFSYGIQTLSEGREPMTFRRIFLNPGIIGSFIGLFLYLTRIQIPGILFNGLDSIAGLSSPLGMILLGGYLARSQIKEVFNNLQTYWTTFNRLIIAPLLGILVISLLPISNPTVLLVLSIVNCAPTAVNTAVFSQIYGGDYKYGARIVTLSSIFSLISMPVMIALSSLILNISL